MADSKITFEGEYIRGLGRRKSAVAQVRVYKAGKGQFQINGREMKNYFPVLEWQQRVMAALTTAGMAETADVSVRVLGGGIAAQADSVSLGIARALIKIDADLRASLKAEGLLSRDARVKERKKPGLKKARKAAQW
ncbi:30S ribosomal protein S9, partial [Candidatus Woesearchaeota archaeon]|nr:30S ribosomal protein S9 [Candidatus Woesearchaeota archaeon]